MDGFRIGSLESGSIRAGVSDLSCLAGVRIDAIVGLDVLARSNFIIDYGSRVLRYVSNGQDDLVVPMEIVWPFVTVRMRIAGEQARFLVDTGSGDLVLFKTRMSAALSRPPWKGDKTVQYASGPARLLRSSCDRSLWVRIRGTGWRHGRSTVRSTDTPRTSMVCSVCWLSAARECGSTSSEVSWLERVSRPRRAPTRRVECGSAFSTQDRALENGFRIGGSHYVDPSLNTITGPDGPTRLEPKVMQVLVCLTAHAGEVVTKDRLMRTVWPDTFVGDDVLTRAISELRRVFGDDAKEPRVIQTIPKSGYRLIAGLSSEARETLAERRQGPAEASVLPARRTKRRKPVLILVGTVLLAAVAISGWWIASPRQAPSEPPRQPAVTQLTANPPDLPVTSARVSPDGKYLAYADPTGIQVRVIDTGETQRIAETRGMDVYAWSGDGTKIRTAACDSATCTGWDISLVGGTRRRSGAVWPVTDFVISTPDGSRLLRITNSSRELWIDLVDGSAPRRLVDLGQNGSANWSADGERVLFTRGDTPSTVESMPLAGGSPSVVFKADEGHRLGHTEPPIGMFLESRDGSLLMLLSDTQTNAVAVWEIPIDRSSGVARGSPRRLTEGTPDRASVGAFSGSWILNASSDGRRVVLRSDTSHGDIYVARFDERQGRLLDPPRRLTSDERGSFPGAWTPDGKAILFNSGQSGTQDIFTLSLNDESAEPLVAGPGDQVLPRMSSDGQWVLFLVQPTGAERWRVMRVPLAGGRPEQVLARAGLVWPRCSIVGRCVLLEKDRDGWIISSLDPVRGKGERLFSLPFDIRGGDLSPDGNALAFVLEGSRPRNRIRIYSLGGEPQQDVVVENASTLVGLDWAATGAGLFSSNVTPGLSELLFIRLDGTSHVLWSQRGTPVWAVPSPDGAHLAIGGLTRQSNIWMLTDF